MANLLSCTVPEQSKLPVFMALGRTTACIVVTVRRCSSGSHHAHVLLPTNVKEGFSVMGDTDLEDEQGRMLQLVA